MLMACLACVLLCSGIVHAADDEINERCIVSVAVDVSGSMKRTDANRDMPETIKMILDACDENDYFSIVAYNDKIAYYSGLISAGDGEACLSLKNDLDALTYAGNTDNGLGLLHAVKEITDFQGEYDRALVILISDGNTDLVGSNTGRNADDSKKDIETSTELAKEKDFPIYVIEYTDDFTTDTSLMSMATSATGGGVTMVNDPKQFVQVTLNSFFAGYGSGKTFYSLEEADEKLNRLKFDTVASEKERELFLFYTWGKLVDAEALDKEFLVEPEGAGRYLILEAKDHSHRSVELLYSLEKQATVMLGTVKLTLPEKPAEPEVIVKEIEVEVEVKPESAIPVGKNLDEELYSSNTNYKIGVSSLFKDDDIVSYKLKSKDDRLDLEEGILTVNVSREGEIVAKIEATDAAGNTATATVTITVTAAWRQYEKLIIIGIIAAIVLVTAIVCFVIIRRILFHEQKKTNRLSGELIARFVDIKSKNDLDEVRWKLSQYPPEGISLEELFRDKGIREELKDIDKVCFYPGEEAHTIQLVHCIEGGVFIGDHHVRSNVPTIVRSGNKIYVSIAENASEIELTYLGK